jgi:hypothetical protein
MTKEELLLREGAAYFGNRLIYRNQDVGVISPGAALVLTPEGEDVYKRLSNITDVEVKPARKPAVKVDRSLGDPNFIDAA